MEKYVLHLRCCKRIDELLLGWWNMYVFHRHIKFICSWTAATYINFTLHSYG